MFLRDLHLIKPLRDLHLIWAYRSNRFLSRSRQFSWSYLSNCFFEQVSHFEFMNNFAQSSDLYYLRSKYKFCFILLFHSGTKPYLGLGKLYRSHQMIHLSSLAYILYLGRDNVVIGYGRSSSELSLRGSSFMVGYCEMSVCPKSHNAIIIY